MDIENDGSERNMETLEEVKAVRLLLNNDFEHYHSKETTMNTCEVSW